MTCSRDCDAQPFFDGDGAAFGDGGARDQAEERTFPGAVLAHEREFQSAPHRKIDLGEDRLPV